MQNQKLTPAQRKRMEDLGLIAPVVSQEALADFYRTRGEALKKKRDYEIEQARNTRAKSPTASVRPKPKPKSRGLGSVLDSVTKALGGK